MVSHIEKSSEIRFTRAIDGFEFEGAFRCLHRSYLQRGLVTSGSSLPMRLIRHHLLPETRVFVARIGRRVIGTLSLIEDRPLGIPVRCIFDAQVNAMIGSDRRVAEASCLAIDDSPVNGLYLVNHLMGLAAQTASQRDISRILIAVHPRHASFYERSAGFQRFAQPTPYPSVQGSPAVGLALNLAMLKTDYPQTWRRYFGMSFSEIALSTRPTSPLLLRWMAGLWQDIHRNSDGNSPRLTTPSEAFRRQNSGGISHQLPFDRDAAIGPFGYGDYKDCA